MNKNPRLIDITPDHPPFDGAWEATEAYLERLGDDIGDDEIEDRSFYNEPFDSHYDGC